MALTIKIEYANKNIGSRSCQEKHRELFYLFIYLFIHLFTYLLPAYVSHYWTDKILTNTYICIIPDA